MGSCCHVGAGTWSKMAVGTANVATALGTSTMPLMRPSHGQHDSRRYTCDRRRTGPAFLGPGLHFLRRSTAGQPCSVHAATAIGSSSRAPGRANVHALDHMHPTRSCLAAASACVHLFTSVAKFTQVVDAVQHCSLVGHRCVEVMLLACTGTAAQLVKRMNATPPCRTTHSGFCSHQAHSTT